MLASSEAQGELALPLQNKIKTFLVIVLFFVLFFFWFFLCAAVVIQYNLRKADNLCTQADHLPPIDFAIELIHFEPSRSGHLSTPNSLTDNDQPQTYLSQYKITSETGQ